MRLVTPDDSFDPFQELQLSPNAEPELIKAAFKALAKKYHPDRFTDPAKKAEAERKMARINEAQRMIADGYRPPSSEPAPPSPTVSAQETPAVASRPMPSSPSQGKKPEPAFSVASFALLSVTLVIILTLLPGLFGGDHLEKALELEKKGLIKESLAELNQAVTDSPHNRELYRHRARLWEKLGHPDRAAVDRQNAETPTLDLKPDQVPDPEVENSPTHVPRTERRN